MLIIRRSKLYYTASDIITPVGGRPVHRLREDLVTKIIKRFMQLMYGVIMKIIWLKSLTKTVSCDVDLFLYQDTVVLSQPAK